MTPSCQCLRCIARVAYPPNFSSTFFSHPLFPLTLLCYGEGDMFSIIAAKRITSKSSMSTTSTTTKTTISASGAWRNS